MSESRVFHRGVACGAPEDVARLEAYVSGDLPDAAVSSLRDHLARCEACARELAWLRAERHVFAERAGVRAEALPDFDSILAEARAASAAGTAARPRWIPTSWIPRELALGLCAAAALLCVLLPRGTGVVEGPGPATRAELRAEPTPLAGSTWNTMDATEGSCEPEPPCEQSAVDPLATRTAALAVPVRFDEEPTECVADRIAEQLTAALPVCGGAER